MEQSAAVLPAGSSQAGAPLSLPCSLVRAAAADHSRASGGQAAGRRRAGGGQAAGLPGCVLVLVSYTPPEKQEQRQRVGLG